MEALDVLLDALDLAHWELGEAMTGMPDGDLWIRPHPSLLSVGELLAHIAYGESSHLTGGAVASPIAERAARYYSVTLESPMSLAMSADELYQEVQRVHGLARTAVAELRPSLEAVNPWRDDWTWRDTLKYMAFHAAYHTGQVYSVRHLLGHETVDN